MNQKEKIENLIKETVRGLYSKPRMNPTTTISRRGWAMKIDVDVSPYYPGLLIGDKGSMKFALELLVGYAFNLDPENGVEVYVTSDKKEEIERTEPKKANPKKILPVSKAIAELFGGTVKVESAETSAMAIFTLPRSTPRDVKPPLSKVIRAVGKAAGFNALPYIHLER